MIYHNAHKAFKHIAILFIMTDTSAKLTECMEAIQTYYQKYKGNDYMLNRIYSHVVTNLPNVLEAEDKNHERRQNMAMYLTEEQQIFMQVFLSKHHYCYLTSTGFFYEYDGRDYKVVKEDDILHKLLSSISKERILLPWKHKTKLAVLKQIKERSLFSSIPESDTIQTVLNALYPSFFNSKLDAKYFLTVVGDNLLKKEGQLTFLVSPKLKQMVLELDEVASVAIGNDNPSARFVSKYHENHDFEHVRLMRINDACSLEHWREGLKKVGLNLLCVAVHYSKRYVHSDAFLESKGDDVLCQTALALKQTTRETMVADFVHDCLVCLPNCSMEWKSLTFVWKQFLASKGLPNVLFSATLKQLLAQHVPYDQESDCFVGVTSEHLPQHKDFVEFWKSHVVVDDNDLRGLELDEVCYLYKQWSKRRQLLSEEYVLKVVQHFFPEVDVAEDKYLLNVCSPLWDKEADIRDALEPILANLRGQYAEEPFPLLSFDELYCLYQTSHRESTLVVSKDYFEKYLNVHYASQIVYDKFLNASDLFGPGK